MLTAPTTMHADEPPPWSASAQPPLDISRWRSDGRLSNLVAQRFDMDNDEALRFALACGGDLDATMGHEPFDRHLRTMILRYDLTSLFHDNGQYPHHHAIKPTGYDYDADEVIPEAMAQWRATYRALPEVHQIIAATDHLAVSRRSGHGLASSCGRRMAGCRRHSASPCDRRAAGLGPACLSLSRLVRKLRPAKRERG